MTEKIRLLIADDQELFVEGICALLAENPEFEVTARAKNGNEAIQILAHQPCDVILLDINMPELDGIQTCHRIRAQYQDIRILMLSSYTNKEFVADVMHSGAHGYLVKNTSRDELTKAIKIVAAGSRYVSPVLHSSYTAPVTNLSIRELEILTLIARGFNAPEIAEKLFLSVHTIHTHRKNIQMKLGLNNQSLLVKYALERGLVN